MLQEREPDCGCEPLVHLIECVPVRERFDAVWVPRVGTVGTDVLWGFARGAVVGTPLVLIAAAAAGLLLGTGLVSDIIGGVLVLVIAVVIGDTYVRRPLRLRALLCQRFGVRVKGFPVLSPQGFDRWMALNGYEQPDGATSGSAGPGAS